MLLPRSLLFFTFLAFVGSTRMPSGERKPRMNMWSNFCPVAFDDEGKAMSFKCKVCPSNGAPNIPWFCAHSLSHVKSHDQINNILGNCLYRVKCAHLIICNAFHVVLLQDLCNAFVLNHKNIFASISVCWCIMLFFRDLIFDFIAWFWWTFFLFLYFYFSALWYYGIRIHGGSLVCHLVR